MPERSPQWLRRTRRAACLAFAVLVAAPATAQAAAPPNDSFADARVVGVGDRLTGTFTDATFEAGEPATTSPLVDHTVWYRLTTAAAQRVRIDTCGSDRHAELAVYTGASVAALTEVTASTFDCTGGARVYLDAAAATTYYVRVGAYDWGDAIVLNVALPQVPANDDFALAQPVGVPANVSGSNVDATLEPGEVDPSPYTSGHSVWYRFTPTTSEFLTVSVVDCADAAGSLSQVTVYTGSSLGALTEVGEGALACGYRSRLWLTPAPGTTYRIAVRGSGHTADAFTLRIAPVPSAPDPGPPGVPNPKCPFELAAPGSITYRGTHSGGGEVCMTIAPDFSGVSWFNLVDPPRDLCIPFAVEHFTPALPILARRFSASTSMSRVSGTFAGQAASGTFQATIPPGGAGICSGRVLTWTATTQATPPPAVSDATSPTLRLRGASLQRALRSGRIAVSARCPRESCAAGASARVAGISLRSKTRKLRPNVAKTLTLRLTAPARRAIGRALRARRSIRTRVTVVALDMVGNPATARRTITLRR